MPHVLHFTDTVDNRGKGCKTASTSKLMKFEFAGSSIIRSKNYWVLCYQSIFNFDSYVEKVTTLLVTIKMWHNMKQLGFWRGFLSYFCYTQSTFLYYLHEQNMYKLWVITFLNPQHWVCSVPLWVF